MRSISAMGRLKKPTCPRNSKTPKLSDGFKITLLVITSFSRFPMETIKG
jgi:hypothetical protein